MEKRSLVPLVAVALVSLVTGCRPATDANTPCFLVAANDDGGRKGLTEADLKSLNGMNHDFISFGSVECDDQICVRDSKFGGDGGTTAGTQKPCPNGDTDCAQGEICSAESFTNPTTGSMTRVCSPPAPGYCSHSCIAGQNCPSQDSSFDDNPSTRLTCRSLLLDADTLSAICSGDGGMEQCVKAFGGNTSPFFCARGSSPDGGS